MEDGKKKKTNCKVLLSFLVVLVRVNSLYILQPGHPTADQHRQHYLAAS